ncbi:MAG: BatD family protein [Bacteriovoracales bacterium]|nr:BatD family protein [Bacteriovoracales bacterium]
MKMIFYLILILIFSIGESFAIHLDIDVEPRRPRVNSSYTVTFRIAVKDDEDPRVDFNTIGMNAIGRPSRGISVRTKFINGKLLTEKELTYSYKFMSKKEGDAVIKDIKVKIGSKSSSFPDVKIKISADVGKLKSFFVEAEVPKREVFVGEGITIKYYMYSKGNVKNYELKSYPKLSKFLKRFINRPERAQSVEIGGEIFRRDLLYAARVFPEKPGKYYIDPMSVRVEYSKTSTTNPFSLNFSFHRIMVKNIHSEEVIIVAKPLPPAPLGINFTGLVGKHSFKLTQAKNRYVVNEAIEINLEVSGGGALEAYTPPGIYTHPEMEEFEMSSDLRIIDMEKASKIYEYTYLPRNPLEIKASKMELVYFDPDEMLYKKIDFNIPGLVAKGLSDSSLPSVDNKGPHIENKNFENKNNPGSGIVAPIWSYDLFNKLNALRYINVFLLLILFGLILSFLLFRKTKNSRFEMAKRIVKSLRRGEVTYSDIFQLFQLARMESQEPLEVFIKKQNFSKKTQDYLLDLVKSSEKFFYLKGEETFRFKYDKGPFSELLSFISKC